MEMGAGGHAWGTAFAALGNEGAELSSGDRQEAMSCRCGGLN